MTRKGSLGWIILLGAMAVPALLFYNWWSNLNGSRRREMAKKVRLRIPEEKLFSTPAPQASRLTNPISSQNAATQPASTGTASIPVVEAVPVEAPVPEAAPAQAPAPQTEAPVELLAAVSQAPLRDPTLSPYDLYHLEQLELERRVREHEMKAPSASRPNPVRNEKQVENALTLEGIVINEESGNRAIVNGEVFAEGDSVGKAKISRITPQGVLFLYKNRKFMKWINK